MTTVFQSNAFQNNAFQIDSVASITGVLAATEAADTFAGVAKVTETAVMAATETKDIFAGVAKVVETAVMAATEAKDVFAAVGTVAGSGTVTGTMAATEAPDIFAGVGFIPFILDTHDPGPDQWLRKRQAKKRDEEPVSEPVELAPELVPVEPLAAKPAFVAPPELVTAIAGVISSIETYEARKARLDKEDEELIMLLAA